MALGRLTACKSLLETKGLDALLVTSPASVFYLSGFLRTPSPRDYLRPIAMLLTREGLPELFVPTVERTIAERRDWGGITHGYTPDGANAGSKISESLARKMARSVGVERESLPMAIAEALRTQLHDAGLVDITRDLESLWWVKSDEEVTYIERAAQLCSVGYQAALRALEEHAAELVAKGRGDCAIFEAAAQDFPQNRIQVISGVIAGERTAAAGAHEVPTGRVPQPGEVIFLGWCVSCEGYWAMISRTIVWQPSESLKRIQERLEVAKQAALKTLRPGVEGGEIYRVAIDALNSMNDPPISSVFVGRGIGAITGESPMLEAECRIRLQPGMALWIGPEIYGAFGGFGAIDTLVITSNSYRILTQAATAIARQKISS